MSCTSMCALMEVQKSVPMTDGTRAQYVTCVSRKY